MKTAVVLRMTMLAYAGGNVCLSRKMWAMAATNWLAESGVLGLVCRGLVGLGVALLSFS